MTPDQIRKILDALDETINRGREKPFPVRKQDTSVPGISFSHLRWMIQRIHGLVERIGYIEYLITTGQVEPIQPWRVQLQGEREKVMRWLGFIQGALVDRGAASIDEMRDLNQ